MQLSLRHVLYALIGAVIVYIVREIRRRRVRVHPRWPDLTMEEAWELYVAGTRKHPDRRIIPAGVTSGRLPAAVREDARRTLLEIEKAASRARNPRLLVRRAILANATLALLLETIAGYGAESRQALIRGYEEGMDSLLRSAVLSSTVKWVVLRLYARWKFDDAVPDDWFHLYLHTARPYIGERVRLAREFVLSADAGTGRFAEIYDALLGELQEKALKARPKKRFARPDLPWGEG